MREGNPLGNHPLLRSGTGPQENRYSVSRNKKSDTVVEEVRFRQKLRGGRKDVRTTGGQEKAVWKEKRATPVQSPRAGVEIKRKTHAVVAGRNPATSP